MLAAIFVKGLKQCFICVKQRKKIHMHAILVTQDINGAHVRVGGRCIWMVNGVMGGGCMVRLMFQKTVSTATKV